MRLEAKLAALEKARPSAPPPWETVVVDQATGETRRAALARHFGGERVLRNARLIVVTIGDAE
ncbi:hypothetical protein [Dankookia sp. P2]|uniref:hypothetical protein n=1 Tax=Dankookia sp. P2 TaxID=3423955 RepID=UPI003D67AED7